MAVYTVDACYKVTWFVRHKIEAQNGYEAIAKIKRMEDDKSPDFDEDFWNNATEYEDSAGPVWFELVSVEPG